MFKNVVPVTPARHGRKRVKPATDYRFAARQYLCPIVAAEFPRVVSSYPIVFLKDKEGVVGTYAMLGVREGRNLFVDAEGRWRAAYIPGSFRRYPFIFARTAEANKFTLCVDEESELLSETEGEPLFTEAGEPAERLKRAIDFLKDFQQQHMQTEAVCRALEEQGMLRPLEAQVRMPSGKEYAFKGFLAVDEQKFNALSDEAFLLWRKRGWLPLVYSHLASLSQMANLAERHEQASGGEEEAPRAPSSLH